MVAGPVGGRKAQGIGPDLGSVEELVDAAHEEPDAVDASVGVVIADGLVNPPVAVLDLGLAVHVAGGVVGPLQVDLVGAHVEDGYPDGPKLPIEGLPEGVTAADVASYPDVGNEQGNQHVEVSAVGGHRVAGHQLADLGLGDQAVHGRDPGRHVPPPPTRRSAHPPGVRPSVLTRREANCHASSTSR